MQIVLEKLPVLFSALPLTFELLFLSVAIAFVLALLLTAAKLSSHKVLRGFASVYISFMRGTPMIAQILITFIGIPILFREVFGISTAGWNNMVYAVVAFSLNEAAFFAEIFRSAYLAIDRGQMEAGQSIGMNRWQVFRRIIFPQAAASALPNTTNMVIELMKNTSLGMAIGVVDLMGMAKQVSYNTMGVGQTSIFLAVAVLYWLIGIVFMVISSKVTQHLNRWNSPNAPVKKRWRMAKRATGGDSV